MARLSAAPRVMRRIAARRVFRSLEGRPVVLTIGVPERVPGSDWGCAVQITGLNATLRPPRYVFGIDGLQALHLAMECANAVLRAAEAKLVWLGEQGDLGLPRFMPEWPKPQQRRLEALVNRETAKFWRGVERAQKKRTTKSEAKPAKRAPSD